LRPLIGRSGKGKAPRRRNDAPGGRLGLRARAPRRYGFLTTSVIWAAISSIV
jgi:hypothetical protein